MLYLEWLLGSYTIMFGVLGLSRFECLAPLGQPLFAAARLVIGCGTSRGPARSELLWNVGAEERRLKQSLLWTLGQLAGVDGIQSYMKGP